MPNVPKELTSSKAFFSYLGVGSRERKFLEQHAFYRYTEVAVPKRRKGTRVLLVPERRLKFLQRKTLKLLSQLYSPRVPVHGFVQDRGAITNANAHQKRPYLINIDLRNFFGVISGRRVRGMLESLDLNEEVALATCHTTVKPKTIALATNPIASSGCSLPSLRNHWVLPTAQLIGSTRRSKRIEIPKSGSHTKTAIAGTVRSVKLSAAPTIE